VDDAGGDWEIIQADLPSVLEVLQSHQMTVDVLMATHVGRLITRIKRSTSSSREVARGILKQWKQLCVAHEGEPEAGSDGTIEREMGGASSKRARYPAEEHACEPQREVCSEQHPKKICKVDAAEQSSFCRYAITFGEAQ